MDAFQDDSLLPQADEGNGGSQSDQRSQVPLELSLKSFDVFIPHDSNDDDKAPTHATNEVEMGIDSLDYTCASCSNDDILCVAIGAFLNPKYKSPTVVVVLEHSDCLPIFVPTFGASIVDISKYLLSGLFHLELQTIAICLNVMGLTEKVFGMMPIPPSHAKGHGHNFLALLAVTYCVVGLCCSMVLRPTIYDASMVPTSLYDGKTFDEDILLSTLFGVPSLPLRDPYAPSAITSCAQ